MNDLEKLRERIAELESLKKGWYEGVLGQGEPINEFALGLCEDTVESLIKAGVTGAFIFPTLEGGVECEWDFKDCGVVLQFGPGTYFVEFTACMYSDGTGDSIYSNPTFCLGGDHPETEDLVEWMLEMKGETE